MTDPNFLIVGAAKSGTTSLHAYLNHHPDVFLPETKEPSFFVAPEVAHRIPTWIESEADYDALFASAGSAAARGEASVLYLYFWRQAIPRVLKKLGSQTKIIVILRNPIDRAMSAYFDCQRFDANETLNFEEALAMEDSRVSDSTLNPMLYYKRMGLYADMVSGFQSSFDHVKVTLFEHLVRDPQSVLTELLQFLNVSVDLLPQSDQQRMNSGGRHWGNQFLGSLVKRAVTPGVRRALSGLAPGLYARLKGLAVDKLMTKAPSMSAETRSELAQYYSSDVHRLSQLVQLDLGCWADFD
ncbi:MAG: sulfotransferase [Pseudomonadota bacterium]